MPMETRKIFLGNGKIASKVANTHIVVLYTRVKDSNIAICRSNTQYRDDKTVIGSYNNKVGYDSNAQGTIGSNLN